MTAIPDYWFASYRACNDKGLTNVSRVSPQNVSTHLNRVA